MAYYVYILKSERDGTYYIDQTNNLEERLVRHNLIGALSRLSTPPFAEILWNELSHLKEQFALDQ